jgi:hypothetical protein
MQCAKADPCYLAGSNGARSLCPPFPANMSFLARVSHPCACDLVLGSTLSKVPLTPRTLTPVLGLVLWQSPCEPSGSVLRALSPARPLE